CGGALRAPSNPLRCNKNGVHAVFIALSFAPQNSRICYSRHPAGPAYAGNPYGLRWLSRTHADFKL
ncbi:MAG: hypothetical protein LBI91_06540, partial [Spirochaetaceae bacterium]|nr:hypothetical protein [Spirochaetaceae bacterium]